MTYKVCNQCTLASSRSPSTYPSCAMGTSKLTLDCESISRYRRFDTKQAYHEHNKADKTSRMAETTARSLFKAFHFRLVAPEQTLLFLQQNFLKLDDMNLMQCRPGRHHFSKNSFGVNQLATIIPGGYEPPHASYPVGLSSMSTL